jgi:hypothetical protein
VNYVFLYRIRNIVFLRNIRRKKEDIEIPIISIGNSLCAWADRLPLMRFVFDTE